MYKSKELAIMIAGAFISALVGLFVMPKTCAINIIITILIMISLICLIYGSVWDKFKLFCVKKYRNIRKIKIIGILNDLGNMDWKEVQLKFDWLKYSPQEWKETIENISDKIKVKLISSKKYFHKFNVVFNPYGGAYPEDDLVNNSNLNKIFDYVKNGGIFLNCADMPGFWAYNSLLKKAVCLSEQINIIENNTLQTFNIVHRTPFNKILNIPILRNNNNEIPSDDITILYPELKGIKIFRAAQIEDNINSIITMTINNTKCSPLFSINYGEGQFIISLFWFKNNPDDLLNKLKVIIINNMISLINNKNK